MVYNIIKQHNGFLDVYSEVGLGTTFDFYLPELIGTYKSVASGENVEIKKGEGLILVVDDEPVMRHLAESILKESGYDIIFAENGKEGVEVFKENHDKITAVLLDLVMPKMSGKEAFLLMKEIDPDLKVLLASGFRKDDRVEALLKLGVCDFLQKPYTLIRLSEAIFKITYGAK